MRLEVQVKYARPKKTSIEETEAEKEEREFNRLIGKEDYVENKEEGFVSKLAELYDEKNLEFFYKPYVFDIKDVKDFTPFDEEHTLIYTRYGGQLPIKMPWAIWKASWEHYKGEVIHPAEPLNLKEEQAKKTKK